MIPFKVIEEFLDEDEIEDVLSSLYKLREHWELDVKGGYAATLPSAHYSNRINEVMPRDPIVQTFMLEEFSWLWMKVFEALGEHYGRPVSFHPELTYAGFNLIMGPIDNLTPFYGPMPLSYHHDPIARTRAYLEGTDIWHLDEFGHIGAVNGAVMESLVVPIKLPSAPTGLKWKDDAGEIQEMWYKVGEMGMWSGHTEHAVGQVICEEGESRITLQLFVAILDENVFVFHC
jgi:hypothetical protein